MSDKIQLAVLGASGVGKSALVEMYLRGVFTEKYDATTAKGNMS